MNCVAPSWTGMRLMRRITYPKTSANINCGTRYDDIQYMVIDYVNIAVCKSITRVAIIAKK